MPKLLRADADAVKAQRVKGLRAMRS